MRRAVIQQGLFATRSPGRHVLAGVAALVLSALLHLVFVGMMPPLPIGRPPDMRAVTRMHSVELGDVNIQARPTVARPAAFRPENPMSQAELPLNLDEYAAALEPISPEPMDVEAPPLAGEAEPLLKPTPPPERAVWEARQELLAIEHARYADEISALPRRYQPATPRVPEAPDVTLPAEPALTEALEGTGAVRPVELARTGALAGNGGTGSGAGRGAAWADRDTVKGAAALLDETLAEVTKVQPVEDLLRLSLQRYEPADEEGVTYFKLEIGRQGDEALPVVPKDVLLIQDCSESMTETKLKACKIGLQAWLDRLNPGDRFDLMGFRDVAYRCFGGWTNLTPATRARANWFINGMEARGRTDVYASLQELAEIDRTPDRPVLGILVTDGRPTTGLVDSSDIIEGFSRENRGDVSMFAFGGGTRVNRYLLELLSYRNRGDAMVVRERRQIPGGLDQWAQELSRPVLTGLRYHFAGVDEAEIYPRTLTHLYLDRPLVIYGRINQREPKVAFQVVGNSGAAHHDLVFELPWDDAEEATSQLRADWAWHKAYYLVGEHTRTRSAAILEELDALAREYDLDVPYRP